MYEDTALSSESCLSVSDSYQLHLRVGNWILEKHKHWQTSAAQVHVSNCFALLISGHGAIRSEENGGACRGGAITQPQKKNKMYLQINISFDLLSILTAACQKTSHKIKPLQFLDIYLLHMKNLGEI